jgi:hypothetical protein
MRGKVEVGAEILLRIAREFGRTMEWLLTGEDRSCPLRKREPPPVTLVALMPECKEKGKWDLTGNYSLSVASGDLLYLAGKWYVTSSDTEEI